MEMVKQHMRIIGEKMTEVMGKKNQLPDPQEWPFTTSQDPDEQARTASLSAIDEKGYTTKKEDYTTNTPIRSIYQFTTCPKTFGVDGTKCFRVDPNGVTEIDPKVDPWDGSGVSMPYSGVPTRLFDSAIFSDFLGHNANGFPYATSPEGMRMFENQLAQFALDSTWADCVDCGDGGGNDPPYSATYFVFPNEPRYVDTYKAIYAAVFKKLETDYGIEAKHVMGIDTHECAAVDDWYKYTIYGNGGVDGKAPFIVKVGVHIPDRAYTQQAYEAAAEAGNARTIDDNGDYGRSTWESDGSWQDPDNTAFWQLINS